MREDVKVWDKFLGSPEVVCRPFIDFTQDLSAQNIGMYSDASRSWTKGFGALCQEAWMYMPWQTEWMEVHQPSIEYLELYAMLAAVLTWIHRFRNHRIFLFCDNMSVVHMINRSSSTAKIAWC